MSKIYIDPGHGGSDPGATGHGLREKNVVLDIAKRTRKYLNDNYTGHSIRMSRTTDKFLSLTQRTNDANKWGADIFVSIHINAGGGTGYEDFIYNGTVSGNTSAYRQVLHTEIMKSVSEWTDRGRKRANFAVLRQSRMPAILTENGFIDRKADADKLKSSSFLNRIAKGHAVGIAKALKLKKKVKPVANNKPSAVHKKGWDWLTKQGITNGTNPKGVVTRQQFATMLYRYHRKFGK